MVLRWTRSGPATVPGEDERVVTTDFARVFAAVASHMTRAADPAYLAAMEAAVVELHATFSSGHKLLVFGNGGSSADAEHLCAELLGRFIRDRRPIAAIALTTNQSFLTAWSNDCRFDDVFARQIEALAVPGDIAWGISTSGNSANVVNALMRARELGVRTIGLTGQDGGRAAEYCDVLMAAPLTETPRIQEVHLVTYHAICAALEVRLFPDLASVPSERTTP
jgi:D-sedoheptulose 7-phosphate isomerase